MAEEEISQPAERSSMSGRVCSAGRCFAVSYYELLHFPVDLNHKHPYSLHCTRTILKVARK
jgi:hypothetical protein